MEKDADDVYDISKYSEEDLYNILDLNSPSDRELEAKILSMIDKYKANDSIDSEKLTTFFENIYSHFFVSEQDIEDSDEFESPMNINTEIEDTNNIINEPTINEQQVVSNNDVQQPATTMRTNNVTENKSKVSLTKPLNYANGKLNPLLNQTIKRVISIDSQYRENKEDLSTEFTFNLSDPLKDVVSLKLYSVQIPYTWYTINNNFGSNFFVFTANSPGIQNDNGTNDFTINVNAGNYTAQELVDTLNSSIDSLKNTISDISFGNTGLALNPNTSLVTMDIDIKKRYNETSYYLNFLGYPGYPNTDDNKKRFIPSILGLTDISYNLFNVKSAYNSPPLANDTRRYQLTTNNNFFTVYIYVGDDVDGIPNNVDLSFNITMSQNSGSYTRSQLRLDLDEQIQNSVYLSEESYIKRYSLNNASNSQTRFELRLKSDRFTTNNIASSKLKVFFPSGLSGVANGEPDIFVGSGSVFGFDNNEIDINTIISQSSPINDSTISFISSDTPNVKLSCNKTNYNTDGNNIILNITNNLEGYSLSQFITEINTQIDNESDITTSNSSASINSSSIFELALDITRNVNEDSFLIDISNGILSTILDMSYNGDLSFNLSEFNNIPYLAPYQTTYSSTNSKFIARITGVSNSSASENYSFDIFMGSSYYQAQNDPDATSYDSNFNTTYTFSRSNLISGIRDAFQSYSDIDSDNILVGSDITFIGDVENGNISGILDINILKQLTENDYSIQFIDPSGISGVETYENNVWRGLNIDQNMIDLSFALANSTLPSIDSPGVDLSASTVDSEGNQLARIIKGYQNIDQNQIILTETTNKFELYPYEEGVVADENIITFTIPLKDENNDDIIYTRTTLINTINSLFESNSITRGSILSILDNDDGSQNSKLKITINKVYTASDYNITFFDNSTFAKCFAGVSSVRNATWDTTLGWILGFREYTVYELNNIDYENSPLKTISEDGVITITGDTTISTNLFNYLLLCLDDYNQNHLNDGLVTITTTDTYIQPSSYTNKSNFVCDPATGELTYNTANDIQSKRLTQKQLYSVVEIANSANNSSIISSTGVSGNNFGVGPFEKDVFGLIPLKLAGLQNGQSFVEFGGTLQNQERTYFGPVNLKRMTVRLKTDRGNVLDLNGSNWSFSLICEQLYRQTPDDEN
jgi:hypothetical protein